MEPRFDTARPRPRADADIGAEGPVAPAEPRSWAPPCEARADRSWDTSPAQARPVFTHNAARYARSAEPVAPVEPVDQEPELSPPPRWMMMVAGAAVAALLGALLGGFMHI